MIFFLCNKQGAEAQSPQSALSIPKPPRTCPEGTEGVWDRGKPQVLALSTVNPGKVQEGYEGHFQVEIPPSRAPARRKLRQTQPQVLIKINHCPQLLDTITQSPGINSTDGECN